MPGSPFCSELICATLPAVAECWAIWIRRFLAQYPRRLVTVHAARQLRSRRQSAGAGNTCRAHARFKRYEVYLQDSWQIRPNLSITGGLRYSLYSPAYEVNGLQVAPTISMGEWFDERVRNMEQGIPSNRSPIVTFDLAGPKNGRKGFYDWDKNNFAPRIAAAWSPTAERGFLRLLTGDGDFVVRAGYSRPLTASASAWRRTSTRALHSACRRRSAARSARRTKRTQPFDSAMRPLYHRPCQQHRRAVFLRRHRVAPASSPKLSMTLWSRHRRTSLASPSVARFHRNLAFEVGYLGRLGRDALVRRDIAMPLNLVDTRSGTSYFSAAQAAINAAQARGITRGSPPARLCGSSGDSILGEFVSRRSRR